MDPRLVEAIQEILLALLKVLGVVLAAWGTKFVRGRFTADQMKKATDIANIVVAAAEQMAAVGQIDYKSKFDRAFAMARDFAAAQGIAFTDEQWKGLLEAAVKTMADMGDEIKQAPAA